MPVGGARDYRPAAVLGERAPHAQIGSTPIPNTLDRDAVANHPLAKWIPYFGVPPGGLPAQTAGLSTVRDIYNLPEAYGGVGVDKMKQNGRITTLLINRIKESKKYPITRLLPLQDWNGGLEVAWDTWKFHDHRLGRVPEQGVSRLLTSSFSEDRAYIVRWGLMFALEHGTRSSFCFGFVCPRTLAIYLVHMRADACFV